MSAEPNTPQPIPVINPETGTTSPTTHTETPPPVIYSALRNAWNAIAGRGLYVVLGFLLLGGTAIAIFSYLRSSNKAAESELWRELTTAKNDKKLEEIIGSPEHSGKITRSIAQLFLAREWLYEKGFNRLGTSSTDGRAQAIANVEKGRDLYLEASKELESQPALLQETWISLSRAEELLSGVPTEKDKTEYRGSIEKSIEYLKKAGSINPEAPVSKKYAEAAEQRAAKKDEITKFYRELYTLGNLPSFSGPSGPGFPGGGSGNPFSP